MTKHLIGAAHEVSLIPNHLVAHNEQDAKAQLQRIVVQLQGITEQQKRNSKHLFELRTEVNHNQRANKRQVKSNRAPSESFSSNNLHLAILNALARLQDLTLNRLQTPFHSLRHGQHRPVAGRPYVG